MCRASCIRSRGFKLAITSEIIGKLGGADVEVTPVEGTASGPWGSEEVLHTVEVPEGETWLVAVTGEMPLPTTTSNSGQPELRIGQFTSRRAPGKSSMGVSSVITETTTVTVASNSGSEASFTGHIYTVKM